ncbi:hypothetical protein PI125_g1266 [Phytophthora idaei]|nr:hypothetical protein PI125_g1266 [Phytophthora idaei]KAG3146857.1 hypothetical protein PI126_g13126 [Phytophthora idaei]
MFFTATGFQARLTVLIRCDWCGLRRRGYDACPGDARGWP